MPRHKGIQREVWTRCETCGFQWPLSKLTSQKGLLKCPECVDNLLVEERPALIAQVLESGSEFEDMVGDRKAEDTEIPEL